MPRDGTSEEHTDDHADSDSIEQRFDDLEEEITSLKEENQRLEAALERQQSGGSFDVTRRQALGGLLGGGALLGAAGSASAHPGNGNGGPPFADEGHDHSGDFLGDGSPVGRLDVEQINVSNDESLVEEVAPYLTRGVEDTGSYRSDDRKIYSTEAQQFHVDPDEGDDSNDGSEDAPFRTLERASEELALFQFHGFGIKLLRENPENKYDSAHFPPSILGYDGQFVQEGTGKMFEIEGDRDNPSAYPFERQRKLGIGFGWNVDVPNVWVAGVELGSVNLDGTCTFADCNFTGWSRTDTPTCVAGYTGRGNFRSCTFTAEATHAFGGGDGQMFFARNSTFETDSVMAGTPFKDKMGSFVFLQSDPGIPFYRNEEELAESNAYIQVDGPVLNGSGTLLAD